MKVVVFYIVLLSLICSACAPIIADYPDPNEDYKMEDHEMEDYKKENYKKEDNKKEDYSITKLNTVAFVPHLNLLNEEIWTRVSAYRFECEFLRLAVEFRDHNYVLVEMDGEQRELAKSINYELIKNKIVELTLNTRPEFESSKSKLFK